MTWNLRKRVAELRKGLVTVVCRHPLELLLLLALTVTLIVCLESNRDPGGARCVVLGWGALLLLIVNRLTMHTRLRILYWVAWVALVPLFFSRAGSVPGISAGRASAVVSLLSYSGLLFFPPFLGFVARDRGLPDALLIVLAACLCLAAGSVFFRGGKKR